ncbi:hypothetical protein [Micromonospora arida]|uniref:hypothetical protein n=1 Tax=Micromonospora arida TaxID=2203715 RepID=UPI003CE87D46
MSASRLTELFLEYVRAVDGGDDHAPDPAGRQIDEYGAEGSQRLRVFGVKDGVARVEHNVEWFLEFDQRTYAVARSRQAQPGRLLETRAFGSPAGHEAQVQAVRAHDLDRKVDADEPGS